MVFNRCNFNDGNDDLCSNHQIYISGKLADTGTPARRSRPPMLKAAARERQIFSTPQLNLI